MSVQTPSQCRNCNTHLSIGQVYCSACGQKLISERLTLHEIARDLIHAVFHVDRSALKEGASLTVNAYWDAVCYMATQVTVQK